MELSKQRTEFLLDIYPVWKMGPLSYTSLTPCVTIVVRSSFFFRLRDIRNSLPKKVVIVDAALYRLAQSVESSR